MLIDYNLVLVLALWLLMLSNFIVLLQPGEGLLFLPVGKAHLHIPSWRAAMGGKLLVWLNPLRALQPIARVNVFGQAGTDALSQLTASEKQLRQLSATTAPLALAAALLMCVALPAAILMHRNIAFVLSSIALAYGLYGAALLLGWRRARKSVHLPPGIAPAAFEALCCLPYAAQLQRRASLLMLPCVPLAELLASDIQLDAAHLKLLVARIQDYRAIATEGAQMDMLDTLAALIATRQAQDGEP